MTRTRWLAMAVLVMVVLGVSLGTATANQIRNQDSAHSAGVRAESESRQAVMSARTDGLTPAELTPYRSALSHLAIVTAPASVPLWDGGLSAFYQRQTKAYRALEARVDARVAGLIRSARLQARRELNLGHHDLAVAHSLGTTTAASASLASLHTAFVNGRALAVYRRIALNALATDHTLAGQIVDRQRLVSSVVQQAGGSDRAIVSLAAATRASAEARFPLLGLFTTRIAGYRASLDSLSEDVGAAVTVHDAAVREVVLQGEAGTIMGDFNRTVPAKVILVSTEQQSAILYQDGVSICSTPVTTGGPELPTDHGIFHIYFKASPFVFHSPWPPDSPYYYLPTPITYWMPFDGAEGLHDASWRSNFGPGSNFAPTDLGTGNYILGTHGCVNLPTAAAAYLWNWAPVGTTVAVI